MKVGVISNMCSTRNRDVKTSKNRFGGDVVLHQLDGVAGMSEALSDMARREVDAVIFDGGDGTVQAGLTLLQGASPFPQDPFIGVLPSGMTNVIAKDVGVAGGVEGIRKLISAGKPLVTKRRTPIKLTGVKNERPIYGMLFGSGAFVRAVELCRREVHARNLLSSAAVAATLAWLLAQHALRLDGGKIIRRERVTLRWDSRGQDQAEDHDNIFVLASALSRLSFGMRPFWGAEDGDLRVTLAHYPPRRFLRSAPAVLFGGEDRRIDPRAFISRNARSLSLKLRDAFVFDGEIYQPRDDQWITLEEGRPVWFLR